MAHNYIISGQATALDGRYPVTELFSWRSVSASGCAERVVSMHETRTRLRNKEARSASCRTGRAICNNGCRSQV